MFRRTLSLSVLAVVLAGLAACGSDNSSSSPTTAASTVTTGAGATAAASGLIGSVTDTAISPDRCEANRKAGKITYLSSFDFAASASIVDVIMAKERGYFDKLCLDVELRSSFSTANYPLVAAGQGQFSSAGSYSEVLNYAKDGASYVVLAEEGKEPVDALIVKADAGVTQLSDLKGKTIGVLGALPTATQAMLFKAGLKEGTDFQTVLLDGFDPVAQFQLPIVGRPGYKSNEPGILTRAGVKFVLFDPAAEGIPGSFGVLYTSKDFHDKNPTATQDFVRAAMAGLHDAVHDPDAAVAASVKLINTAGNQNGLTEEGESFRWHTESKLVTDSTPAGEPLGLLDPVRLQAEVDAYTAAGVFPDAPPIAGTYDAELIKAVYAADGTVIMPA